MSFRDPGAELESTELPLTSASGCGVIALVGRQDWVRSCGGVKLKKSMQGSTAVGQHGCDFKKIF